MSNTRAHERETFLTVKERRMLAMWRAGQNTADIADKLGMKEAVVDRQLRLVRVKART